MLLVVGYGSDRILPPCNFCHHPCCVGDKEYVAILTGLYKNNGAVSCVSNYFTFIYQLYPARTQVIYLGISHGVTNNFIPNAWNPAMGRYQYRLQHILITKLC